MVDEKVEFHLPQTMDIPTLDYTCCRVNALDKVLNQEAMPRHSVEDPLEVILISYNVMDSHTGEKEEYARLLNTSSAYTHKQSPNEVLNV